MMIDLTPSQVMALKDILVAELVKRSNYVYVDVVRQVETTVGDLLVALDAAEARAFVSAHLPASVVAEAHAKTIAMFGSTMAQQAADYMAECLLSSEAPPIVHYMVQGSTACGLRAGDQNRWPGNHRWVSGGREFDVTGCVPCMGAALAAGK